MPMREECKNFESRTYANGETVRKCNLDLAPDAPWRCPDKCPAYERRLADVGWDVRHAGQRPEAPDEPPGLDDGSAAAVLDEAEDILNSVGPGVLAEVAGRAGQAGLLQARLPAQALSADPEVRPVSTFSTDAAAALPGPGSAAGAAPGGPRAVPRRLPAVDGGGDLALQPHRRARPRRRLAVARSGHGDRLRGQARVERQDLVAASFAEHARRLRRAERRLRRRSAGGRGRAGPHRRPTRSCSITTSPVDGGAVVPAAGHRRRRGREVTVVERFASDDVAALVVPMVTVQAAPERPGPLPRRQPARSPGVADRPPGRPAASATRRRCWPPSPSAATTPGCAPTRASSGQGAEGDQIAVYFGEAHQMHDFRTLQDHAAPKTTLEPAVQGRRRRATPRASTPA